MIMKKLEAHHPTLYYIIHIKNLKLLIMQLQKVKNAQPAVVLVSVIEKFALSQQKEVIIFLHVLMLIN
jgi:uncharacterized membrane protein